METGKKRRGRHCLCSMIRTNQKRQTPSENSWPKKPRVDLRFKPGLLQQKYVTLPLALPPRPLDRMCDFKSGFDERKICDLWMNTNAIYWLVASWFDWLTRQRRKRFSFTVSSARTFFWGFCFSFLWLQDFFSCCFIAASNEKVPFLSKTSRFGKIKPSTKPLSRKFNERSLAAKTGNFFDDERDLLFGEMFECKSAND